MLPLLLGRVPGKLMESGREIGLSSEAGPSVGLHQVGLADLLRRPRSYPVPYCSIAKLCPTLRPHGLQSASFPVLHYFPEFVQTHVYRVSDAIQPSHPLFCPLFFIHNYVLWGFCLFVCSHCLDPHCFFVYATLLKKNKSIATRAIT